MSDEGRLVAGRYRMIERIGAGAMGAVWQAHDEVLGRTVAVKQLLLQAGLDAHEAEEARARTMREGRIAARLHHPNAITVFDVVTDDNGQPCLIMEYLESTSLAQELQRHDTLDPVEVAGIGAQVASALAAAHAVGIVHRDIKPGNILLADNGLVKLTDFGISRAQDDVTVTKTGMIAGTPAYLAPEVAIGQDPGPESDIFSLGSTLYAATEGQPPFGLSENTLSLLHAVAAGQILPPRQSGPLTSVLAVMLHPETQHRPNATECEDLLIAVSRGETPLGGSGDDPTRMSPSGPGAGTALLGGAAAGAAAGAIGGALADGDPMQGRRASREDLQPTAYQGQTERYGTPPRGYPPADDYNDPTRAMGNYGDPDRTRAVAGGAYGDYNRHGGDGYGTRDGLGQYGSGADDDEPKSNWKVPALIGSAVVIGLAAFAFWIFGGGGSEGNENPPPRQVATTSNVPSSTSSTTTTPPPEETYSEPEYVPPPEPEEPTETSTSTSTSTSTPTETSEPSETDEPDDSPTSLPTPTNSAAG